MHRGVIYSRFVFQVVCIVAGRSSCQISQSLEARAARDCQMFWCQCDMKDCNIMLSNILIVFWPVLQVSVVSSHSLSTANVDLMVISSVLLGAAESVPSAASRS